MAGYDLEFIKLILNRKSTIKVVGDPRQVTYHTHSHLAQNIKNVPMVKLIILSTRGAGIYNMILTLQHLGEVDEIINLYAVFQIVYFLMN